MILKGRISRYEALYGGILIELEGSSRMHVSPQIAEALGIAITPLDRWPYYQWDGIEQDVEIEVRRVDG